MLYKNVRDLIHNFDETTKDLPVVITKFGKPIFMILPFHPNPDTNNDEAHEAPIANNLAVPQRCQMPGCKENAHYIGEVWNEVIGDMVAIDMCEKHYKNYLKETGKQS